MAKAVDFSKGKISRNIIAQAIPMILAQIVQLLYNVVDRIYIGHLPGADNLALTGVGLAFPIVTLVAAFTNLFGTGGAPLFAIARGKREEERAKEILGNTCSLLLVASVILWVVCFICRKPVLYLFGASDASYLYADAYLKVYLCGTVFTMLAVGLNGFINAQGFAKTGMLTTAIGAVLNLILDPVFIFVLDLGVSGAAAATVISQMISCGWVLYFLTKKETPIRIHQNSMKICPKLAREIISLGTAGFMMQGTNCIVQVVCNATLKWFGGDIFVGIMTVINAVRDILSLPVMGLSNGAQPVLSFNYGAGAYGRVKQAIRFTAGLGIAYTLLAWIVVRSVPEGFMALFTSDAVMIQMGVEALQIYFFGFCFMALQFVGQSVFTALGYARQAVFFSLFRKVMIVVPLTLIFPRVGFGVNGVFLAEPISNLAGGLACFLTMWFLVYRRLEKGNSKELEINREQKEDEK